MKLPDMPDIEELEKKGNHGKLNCFQLAQLHCLRSIAVNLEILVGLQAAQLLEGSSIEAKRHVAKFTDAAVKLAERYSVGK